jgi:hypothetical protein
MVAASVRRNLQEMIRAVSWLESLVDEPNETVKEALSQTIAVPSVQTASRHRAAA